jgi:hypothetical protein
VAHLDAGSMTLQLCSLLNPLGPDLLELSNVGSMAQAGAGR